MLRPLRSLPLLAILLPLIAYAAGPQNKQPKPQKSTPSWSFAVSGDSRNCGDFVMPAIAAKVKAENDRFFWHLGDFRWMTLPDEDMKAMHEAGSIFAIEAYHQHAWDDFLIHQLASFSPVPIFLGRGNHETVAPMSRELYIAKFAGFLDRPEIQAQRKADGSIAAPLGPWFHFTLNGVDFITLDNAQRSEFTGEQRAWLRALLDRDLAPNSGIRTVVVGMHEALPHSTGSNHAMDNYPLGVDSGEQVYNWFADAQKAGLHVYLVASHSHYYAPNIYNTPYWRQQGKVVPGWIIGLAGAHRHKLPAGTDPGSLTSVYGYLQGTVQPGGSINFSFQQVYEDDMVKSRWPSAPLDAIHDCVLHNTDSPGVTTPGPQ